MRLFWYRAMTADGASVSGSGEHADLADLMATLATQNLQPYRVWSLPGWLSALLFRPLGAAGIAEFCYLLSQHLHAGADLRLALGEATQSASRTRLRMLCARIQRAVERGDRLGDALESTRAFPLMLSHLVAVGEQTGRLGDILGVAAQQFEQVRQLRAAILRSLIYPAIVMAILLLSCVFWLVVVVPKMTALYGSLNMNLPASTVAVLDAAQWLREHGAWLAVGLVPVLLVLALLWRLAAPTEGAHALLWWMPGIRRLERLRVYHAFFAHMGAMHAAGLTLSRTLSVLVQQPINRYFGRRLSRVPSTAQQGQPLSVGLARCGVFERMAISLIRLGETTGTLDTQSQRLSEHYAARLKAQIDTGSRLFEPLVLIVLAGLLLLIGVTLLGPVYELAAKASSGILR